MKSGHIMFTLIYRAIIWNKIKITSRGLSLCLMGTWVSSSAYNTVMIIKTNSSFSRKHPTFSGHCLLDKQKGRRDITLWESISVTFSFHHPTCASVNTVSIPVHLLGCAVRSRWCTVQPRGVQKQVFHWCLHIMCTEKWLSSRMSDRQWKEVSFHC